MVARFNGRTADVLKARNSSSSEDLEQTLLRCVTLHNHQLPQSAPRARRPYRP